MLFIRENTEGEYSGTGGRVHAGHPTELAVEVPVFTRHAIARCARFAFARAMERKRRLINVTKSNASRFTYVLWDEVIADVGRQEFPEVEIERVLVDAMAARMVTRPDTIDVVIGSNLFADILTDLGAAIQGSMGLAASANLNPEREHPSLFEPVHGSAPDIAGKGDEDAAGRIEAAIERVTAAGIVTGEVGGKASTSEVGNAIAAEVRAATG